jgi:hypothetical protein
MGYQEKIVLVVVVLLFAMAIYFVATTETEVIEDGDGPDTTEARQLLMKGLQFGKGQTDYAYAYRDISDGYITEYALTRVGNVSMVEVENLLSKKRAFFLENDTILCVNYSGDEVCSSVKDSAKVENYLNSLSVKFFDDQRIDRNVRDFEYLLANDYVTLDPEIADRTGCREVSYTLDYTNATVSDAARFGIGVTSPKVFDWKICIDDETGNVHGRSFSYTYEGMDHSYSFELLSFSKFPPAIVPPENLTDGAVIELEKEREQQVKLVNCFVGKEGDEQDKCVAAMALSLKRKGLCEYAGGRRDRCLVSIVPLTKDTEICPSVMNQSFRDDCYIELAGAYKDVSHCDAVQDPERKDFCIDVATPDEEEPLPETEGNETEEENGMDMLDFMEYMEEYDKQDSNATNESNSTGG